MKDLDTGQIRNYLGLLTDSALKKIDTRKFIELAEAGSMKKSQLAAELKMSRPKLYKKEAIITQKEIQERIVPFIYISDLAYLLFGKDRKKTMEWLMAPNHIFFNVSPCDLLGPKGPSFRY
jgi:uncharacterized protein (DUF2384 family)